MLKKRALSSLLPFLSLLFSCAPQIRIGHFFIYDDGDAFMHSVALNTERLLREMGYGFSLHGANRKQSTQNAQVVEVLNKETGTPLIVNIVDRLSASVLIEKAESMQTPLLFVNREPLSEDMERTSWAKENLYYVGADPDYQGRAQAEIARDFFGGASLFKGSAFDKNGDGKLQVALFRGELSHQDAESRSKNSLLALSEFGFEVELIDVRYCEWGREEGYLAMKKILQSQENVELLLSNNDMMALGAVDALLEKEKELSEEERALPFSYRHFPIVGVDGTSEGKKAVEEGSLIGTVLNDSEAQAKILAGLFAHLASGSELPSLPDGTHKNGNFYHVEGSKITAKTQE